MLCVLEQQPLELNSPCSSHTDGRQGTEESAFPQMRGMFSDSMEGVMSVYG